MKLSSVNCRFRIFETMYDPPVCAEMVLRVRVDGKILDWRIAQKSLGQHRVYETICNESGIMCAYFLLNMGRFILDLSF